MDEELKELRRKVDRLERQAKLDRLKTVQLINRTAGLLYSTMRMSLSLHSGNTKEAYQIYDEFDERMRELEKEIDEFGGLDE